MLYQIRLADGDDIIYETSMSLGELKQYILSNDFIEFPRGKMESCGYNSWKTVPHLASYHTKSIVYINHAIELEELRKYHQNIINNSIDIVNEISSYVYNWKMKFWMFRNNVYWKSNAEGNCFNKDSVLTEMLLKCKEYKCKIMTDG